MKKIAVVCSPGLETFLHDVIPFLQSKYMIRTCFSNKEDEIRTIIDWADIVWLEWANELAIALTTSPLLDNKRVICRLHSYEALAGYVRGINWSKIDDLIFVADHVRDLVMSQIAMIPDFSSDFATHVIPNGIDVDKYKFTQREPGPNIAFVGNLSFKKGPMLLIHAFEQLLDNTDNSYRLHIAGAIQDPRAGLYLSHMINELGLVDFVHFDGFIKDISSWLEDKNYIICTSPFESQNLGLMEAMASGIKPLIHNFVGAKGVYDEKYVWTTIPEFVEMITNDDYDSKEYRDFVAKRYLLRHRLKDIQKVIDSPPVKKKQPLPKDPQAPSAYGAGVPEYDEYAYWNRRHHPTATDMPFETTQKHIAYTKKHVAGAKRVLDFGPGIGRTFEAYIGTEFVQGIDISLLYDKRVKDAAKHLDLNFDLKYITLGDLDCLPYGDGEFDCAVASEVLLHLRPQNILKVMKELIRVAKKVIVISWMVDVGIAFETPAAPPKSNINHCFHYNYPEICKSNGWVIRDMQRAERQIYFVYQRKENLLKVK